jgi:hypothetical protein
MTMPFEGSAAGLPAELTPAQVGKACNMSRRKAKSWLRRAGIAECSDGRWFVRTEALRERLPDVFERVRVWIGTARAELEDAR